MNVQLPRFADAGDALAWLAGASAQAAALIVVVLLFRAVLGRRLTPGWRLALWLIVLLRLVVPLAVESRWNLVAVGRRVVMTFVHADVAAATAQPQTTTAGPRVSVTYGPIPSETPSVAPRTNVLAPPARVSTRDVLVVAWLCGVGAFFLRDAASAFRLSRAISRMRPVDDTATLALAARCAREIGVRRRVRLVETDRLRAPAVCGIVRPTILLPADVARVLSPAELRLVLLHELVHVRRDDALVDALARLVRATHWFNPLVWLGVAAFRADRELACDAAVLRAIGEAERQTYGECLLHVVAHVSGTRPHAATLGVFGSSRHLRRRIDMIASGSTSWRSRVNRAAIGVGTLLAIGSAAALAEPSTRPAVDEATLALLARPIAALDLYDRTLERAADTIAKAGGVPIRIEWDALAAVGLSRTTPSKPASLKNVRPIKALEVVFYNAKPSDGPASPFDYEVVDGAIVFSTAADIAKRFGTASRTFALNLPANRERNEQVATLIIDTIDSPSWKRNGGTGTIEVRATDLVVTHTPRRLAEVARLFEQLNETRAVTQPTTRLRLSEPGNLIGSGATTQPTTATGHEPPSSRSAEANLALARVLPELRFDRVPFTDAIDFVRDTTGANLVVKWDAIEAAGVNRTTPVTVHQAGGGTLARTLTTLLDAAGGKAARLGFVVDAGVVTISTQADVDLLSFCTRVYDIRDLLDDVRKNVPGSAWRTDAELDAATTRWAADLTAQIAETIDRGSWKANGGQGDLQVLSGQLIVTQSDRIHAQIEAMIERLRTTRNLQPAVATRLILLDAERLPTAIAKRLAATTQPLRLDATEAATIVALPADVGPITSPRVLLLSGQRATIDVVLPRDATTTTRPAGAALDPEFECGIRATVAADRKTVDLAITARFAGARNMIEPLTLDTTVTTPDRGTTMLRLRDAIGGAGEGRVVLLVTPTIVDAGSVTPR